MLSEYLGYDSDNFPKVFRPTALSKKKNKLGSVVFES